MQAVASWGPNSLFVFCKGTDNGLWYRQYSTAGWGNWASLGAPLGTTITTEPVAISWGPNRVDVLVRGTDGALWDMWNDGKFEGWYSLGGQVKAGTIISPTSWSTLRYDFFYTGTDNGLKQTWWSPSTGWTSEVNLGGQSTNNGNWSCTCWSTNRIDCFVRGKDNTIWTKYWNGSQWNGPVSIGGSLGSDLQVISWGYYRLDLFYLHSDNTAWTKNYSQSGGWSSEISLGSQKFNSAPVACTWGPNRLDVFACGTDNGVNWQYYDGTWHGWTESLNQTTGVLTSRPAVISWGPGRIDLFTRGETTNLYQLTYTAPIVPTSSWSPWIDLQGGLT